MYKHKIVNALPLTHRQKTHLPGTHKLFRAIMKEFSNGNVTFKFVYLSSSTPAVVSVHPSAGSITGGTLVQLRMSNAAGEQSCS